MLAVFFSWNCGASKMAPTPIYACWLQFKISQKWGRKLSMR